jgi:ATP/maltotriose-dependent transcriptional regulator MalT
MRLCDDDPEGALAEAEEGLSRWSRRGFHLQHYNALFSRVTALLYQGQAGEAEALVSETWPAMKKAMVFFIQQMKIRALHLRGCVRLASASPLHPRQKELLKLAEGDVARLDGEKVGWARALARLLEAGCQRTRGDVAKSAATLESAIAELERAEMGLYGAAARYQLGRLRGTGGRALVEAAETFFEARRIRDAGRLARVLAPGFSDG